MRYKGKVSKVTTWNDKRKQPRARDIRFAMDSKRSARRFNFGRISLALAALFLLVVSGAFLAGKIPGAA